MKHTFIASLVAIFGLAGAAIVGTGSDLASQLKSLNKDGSYQIAQSCRSGESICVGGQLGQGGCYNATQAWCAQGMICNIGWSVCTADSTGGRVPYCYEPSKPNTCVQN